MTSARSPWIPEWSTPPGIDLGQWPLVLYTAPPKVTDAEVDVVLEFSAWLRARGDPYVYVQDLRYSSGLTREQRERIASSMRALGATEQAPLRGAAMVFSSTAMRFLLSTMLLFKRGPYPVKVFETPEAAMSWGRTVLGLP